MPKRPECWDFAMDFLGGPEDEQIIAYVESLEAEVNKLMTEERARQILGDAIEPDGRLMGGSQFFSWRSPSDTAILDSNFTADELEAIAWWMRNKNTK